jgi:hypothetical protein
MLAYRFNTWVMPAVFVTAGMLLVWLWRTGRLTKSARTTGAIYMALGALLFCAYVYATHIEPAMLVVREVHIENSSLQVPLRVLHISDIQSARVGRYEERAIDRIKALKPDLVLCTGDFLQPVRPATMQSELPKLSALLSTLQPPLGCYGVYGNVDWLLHNRRVPEVGGMKILENAGVCVTSGVLRIRIYGLSNRESALPDEAMPRLAGWMETKEKDEIVLLMGHMPDYAIAASEFPADLCLAGHTHGGQVRLPLIGPLVTLTRHVPREWTLGFRKIGRARLNVSGGIGCEHLSGLPDIRLGCPPEMTLITFGPGQ